MAWLHDGYSELAPSLHPHHFLLSQIGNSSYHFPKRGEDTLLDYGMCWYMKESLVLCWQVLLSGLLETALEGVSGFSKEAGQPSHFAFPFPISVSHSFNADPQVKASTTSRE